MLTPLAICALAGAPCAQEVAPAWVLPALDPSVSAADLRAHLSVLASDELLGRKMGSPGLRRAAEYVAAVLEAGGVPAAGEGKYFQEVPLVSYVHQAAPSLNLSQAGESRSAQYGTQFDLSIQEAPRSTEKLELLLVRAAADIPANASGKQALAIDASRSDARLWLRERGHEDGHGFGLLLLRGSDSEREREAKLPRPSPQRVERADEPDWIHLHGALASALFSGAYTGVELSYDVREERVFDPNVLARIAARPDSPVADQAIVLSAHLDHIGVVPDTPGAPATTDRIYNGADDDASGVAVLLELATALARAPAPDRTLIFLFATGEEVGLWGTYYYIEHPLVPLEQTLLNLNFEMLGRPDPLAGGPGRMWLTGFERSNLGPALVAAGLPVVVDPRPEQSFFTRSDNMAFVRQNIVGQTLSSYNMHSDYHQVDDESDRLDYEHMAACASTALAAIQVIAQQSFRPEWMPGEPNLRRR